MLNSKYLGSNFRLKVFHFSKLLYQGFAEKYTFIAKYKTKRQYYCRSVYI